MHYSKTPLYARSAKSHYIDVIDVCKVIVVEFSLHSVIHLAGKVLEDTRGKGGGKVIDVCEEHQRRICFRSGTGRTGTDARVEVTHGRHRADCGGEWKGAGTREVHGQGKAVSKTNSGGGR